MSNMNNNTNDTAAHAKSFLRGGVRYAGDVKVAYKLTIREAVVGFILVELAPMKHGGKCHCTHKLLTTVHPELDTNVASVLRSLTRKGVLDSYAPARKGHAYVDAEVNCKFASAVRNSRCYVCLDLFDFNRKTKEDWTLNDRVFYGIVSHLRKNRLSASVNSVSKFMGVTKATIFNKFTSSKFSDVLEIVSAKTRKTSKKPYYKVAKIYENRVRVGRSIEDLKREISGCLLLYSYSGCRFIYDIHRVGLIEKRSDPKYKKVIAAGQALIDEPALKGKEAVKQIRRARYWIQANGHGTSRYEELRRRLKQHVESSSAWPVYAVHIVSLKEADTSELNMSVLVDLYRVGDGKAQALRVYADSIAEVNHSEWKYKVIPGMESALSFEYEKMCRDLNEAKKRRTKQVVDDCPDEDDEFCDPEECAYQDEDPSDLTCEESEDAVEAYSPEKEADAIIAKVTELAKLAEETKSDNRAHEAQSDAPAQDKASADNDKDSQDPQAAPHEDKPLAQGNKEIVDEDGISYKYNMASISDFF